MAIEFLRMTPIVMLSFLVNMTIVIIILDLKELFSMDTRGIRNNNPTNIKRGSNWKGLSPVQSDKVFCQFISLEYGIRAYLHLLRTYHYKYKLNTIRQIISRFCPDGVNDGYMQTIIVYMRRIMMDEGVSACIVNVVKSDFILNIWYNKEKPSDFLWYFAKATCIVESRYWLPREVYENALNLL